MMRNFVLPALFRLALLDLYIVIGTERLFQYVRRRAGRRCATAPESSYTFSAAFWVLIATLPLAYSGIELYDFFTQPDPPPGVIHTISGQASAR